MQRQFTATAYIIEEDKVLLIYHKKLQKWLPPGGHLHDNELPHEGAMREALEETGLEVEFMLQENVWVERWNAKSFPRPYLCLLEEIPAHGNLPAHQHMDLIYIARPIGGELCINDQECGGLRWFTMEEIEALAPDRDIFVETQNVIKTILDNLFYMAYESAGGSSCP